MRMVELSEVALVNPRPPKIPLDDDVSFVGMAELNATNADTESDSIRPFAEVSKGYTIFGDGDILVAKITPCFENNKIGQARLRCAVGVGSTEFHVIRPGAHLDHRYLLHFLRQDRIRQEGALRMTGSAGQRRVPTTFLQQLKIPLPPLDEQRRIAAILGQADRIRASRQRAIGLFDELVACTFIAVFGDDLDSPTTWLDVVADVSSGITKGRRTLEPTRTVPYLAVANVQAGFLDLSTVKEIEATEAEFARYELQNGDLVLTEGGDPDKLGRGTVWRNELPICLHQNHIFRVRIRDESLLDPDFLSAYVASRPARDYFLRSAKQTTGIASINMTQLKGLPVFVPTVDQQRRYLQQIAAVRSQRVALLRQSAEIASLFASLQSRAFRGDLSRDSADLAAATSGIS